MTIDRRDFGLRAAVFAATSAAGGHASAQVTPARRRPTIVAFDAAGNLDASGSFWHVRSELWAYRAQDSSVRKGVIARLFRRRYGLEPTGATSALFDRRVNLLLADNVSRVVPQVRLGGEVPDYPPTRANGHTQQTVRLPLGPGTPTTGGRIALDVTDGLPAQVHLIPDEGISVISDIDDTVKDSGVLDKRRLWEATFFQPFKSVPGMAALLTRLAGETGAVHYVSSTPWHLYAPLREWLADDKFPVSSLHLKQIRLKDQTVLDIFKSPETLKPPIIAGLLRRWPKRRFVLVGDSGEKDPEVYGQIARQFPQQVARILIRRAPGDPSGGQRLAAAFAGLEANLWQVFDTPADVTWSP